MIPRREMTISEATQDLVQKGPVSVEVLAEEVFGGRSASMIYRMLNPHDEGADVPLRFFAPLVNRINQARLAAGQEPDYRPVELICRKVGLLAVPIPVREPGIPDLVAHAAAILKETSEVTNKMAEALRPASPGGADISLGEAMDIRQEAWEAMQRLAQVFVDLDPDRLRAQRVGGTNRKP